MDSGVCSVGCGPGVAPFGSKECASSTGVRPLEYDAHAVDDTGLDLFYVRFWETQSVIGGNQMQRANGGEYTPGNVGGKIVLKFADETRRPAAASLGRGRDRRSRVQK